jgi:hypothetical protein
MFSSGDDETGEAGLHERCVHPVHSAATGQADQERHGTASGVSQPGSCLRQSSEARPVLTGRLGLNHKLSL